MRITCGTFLLLLTATTATATKNTLTTPTKKPVQGFHEQYSTTFTSGSKNLHNMVLSRLRGETDTNKQTKMGKTLYQVEALLNTINELSIRLDVMERNTRLPLKIEPHTFKKGVIQESLRKNIKTAVDLYKELMQGANKPNQEELQQAIDKLEKWDNLIYPAFYMGAAEAASDTRPA